MVLEEAPQYALCLNMIVKDESHIIKDTLTKLFQKIKFDYWIISDTGSTDKTKEIITDFFKEVGIPGELYEDEWVDFSHNRNKALEYAFGKSKYLLIFDADDEICGDFVLPELVKDYYHFQFGSHTRYTRTQIINNCKRWKYVGVLHECIVSNDDKIDGASMEVIKGHYYTVSGRSGNRNLDSNKYLKDAIILEKAYYNAVDAKDDIYHRYCFYCANSYYDCDKYEHAISWYKKTLENCGWSQEKYVSCLKLYKCYEKMNNIEAGFFYLVKSAEYDRERAECYYELIKYYSGSGSHDVAYGYYGVLRNFYNNYYLKDGLNNKLFLDESISEFYFPYYVIIISEKMRDYDTGIQMYRIVFTKKCKCFDEWFIGNLLYNLQFFTEHVKDEDKTAFYSLFQEYVDFIVANNYPLFDETMKIYEKYGIKKREASIATDECFTSKKILIYTGFMDYLWNDTYVSNNPIGGAEKAVAYLARNLPKEYEIIISGDVADEVVGNVKYVNRFKLQALLDVEKFHTIIVSRYVSFFLLFPRFNCYQLYLSAHDSTGFLNNFNGVPVHTIIEENNKYIKGVICLTTWHKLNTIQTHACLKDKVFIINNGILVAGATSNKKLSHNKIKNKFVWTSCSYRGLDVMLKLWDEILEVMPDATLDISSYDAFPNPNRNNDEEIQMIINRHSESVKHHVKLNTLQLHDLISKAEYWLYTNTFCETSCITAFEMLMHEVVCLYYPLAGLVDTIGEYGIQVNSGNEIQSIMNLSEAKKVEMRINGKKYAMSCLWENRAKEWASVLGLNTDSEYLQSNGWEIVESKFSNNDYIIKIINLERRSDRKTDMINKLSEKMVNNYEFFEAVDGNVLEPSVFIKKLFKNNDFNYRKGVIGCALSHYELWNNLINDDKYSYYVILEDDIELVDNFNEYIEQSISIIQKQDIKYALIGGYQIKDQLTCDDIISFDKITIPICSGTFGYIISKEGCKVLVNYLNKNGINRAIDHSDLYTNCLDMYKINKYIVNAESLQIHGKNDTDIQLDYNCLNFDSIPTFTVSFVDWWSEEYCGGTFDINNNFFIKLLSDFYDIKVVSPEENPDILFYSIFGNNHLNLNAKRKIFYTGEAIPQEPNADFNITFDNDNDNNCRLPLWLCYLNDTIKNDYNNKIQNKIEAPQKSKFCSIICQQDNVENTRSEIVNKLSKYKCVDCGGKFMNNIGYVVPRGNNCSGKIEHNNNYKFVIAFENRDYTGYVTEKICDAYKSKCIPIYWGTKDVVKDFNPNTFINANDFVSMDELVEYIINVDNNDNLYASYFKEPILTSYWIDIIINKNNHYFEELAQNIVINNTYYSANIQSTEHLSLSSIVDNILTDKNTEHSYLELYENIMHKNKFTAKNILEIGINVGGSIKLWNDYFINATIYGLDIIESPDFLNKYPRINTFKINAYTIDSVNYFVEKDIKFDFIIDDGPHTLESMIFTLIHYSKLLTPRGVLIIEDIQSIEWAYLFEKITNKYKENTHIYDLRENKGRYDDIVFTFTNSNIENIEFIDYNIEYGLDDNKINITHTVMSHSLNKEFIEIPTDDVLRADLYGNIYWGVVKSIYITTKDGSVTKCKDNYPIILDWQGILNNTIFKIGFYDNGLTERGTTTALYSYADYAEKYFKCKSIIFYNKHHHANNNQVINRFSNRFDVYRVENFDEINNIIVEKNIKYFYNICGGKQDSTTLVKNCKNLIHAVFNIEPFGDIYAGISEHIVKKSKYPDIDAIPHMIDLPIHNDNMRSELKLDDDDFIIGRIGGFYQFDVLEAHNAIIKFLNSLNDTNPVYDFISKINNSNNKNYTYKNETNRKVYFVFVNTNRFYEHPQIIYLDKITDNYLKVKYINTCNCMIHARSDGETFGLAVGEFSSLNKPIITCRSNLDNCHLEILGDKAIIFDSTDSLITILENIQTISNSRDDWNTYKEYTPEKVMIQFKDVFLSNENMYL